MQVVKMFELMGLKDSISNTQKCGQFQYSKYCTLSESWHYQKWQDLLVTTTKRRNHSKIKRNLTNTQHKRKLRSPDPKYHNDPKANFLPPRKNEPRVDMPKPVIRTFHRRLQILHVDGQRQVTDGHPDRGAFTH